MTIDSHQHFWNFNPTEHAWINDEMSALRRSFLPPDIEKLFKTHGIDGCVTVQVSQHLRENDWMLTLAAEHPCIKGVVGWVDLKAGDLETQLIHYRQKPMIKAFRHIVQAEPSGFMRDPRFVSGVRRIGDQGYAYDLLIYHHQLAEALAFLRQVPDTRIVLDHMAKPAIRNGDINDWAKQIKAAAALDHVHCKLSGMVTEADWRKWRYEDFVPYLDLVFEVFGPRRVMYGSDWPVCLLAAAYETQLRIIERYVSTLTESERAMVMGQNAMDFYHL